MIHVYRTKISPILMSVLVISGLGLLAALAVPQFSAYRCRSLSYPSQQDPVECARPAGRSICATEPPIRDPGSRFNTEEYDRIRENPFRDAVQNPLSTFSIDVDTASYSNIRRYLLQGRMPPKDAVRIEEMINYFHYDYPQPVGAHPFSVTTEISQCPWSTQNRLVHIGLQGKQLQEDDLKPCNLVFLIDSSGSMSSPNKLPLLKNAFRLLLEKLGRQDRVAIVAYAGSAGLVLPSTPATHKARILSALDSLRAGGTTAGGAGIKLAYRVAKENFLEKGNNRVILATDGDFNVGVSSTGALVRVVEEKRRQGIYLTLCGFGMGNYKDGRMEQISNAGNGNYFYIDSLREGAKVFVKEMRATLFTIAEDVKIQIEFNPAKVMAYRLIGYENRLLASEDFNDDSKDAGELGSGHTVTALYEVIPAGASGGARERDPLKYQEAVLRDEALGSDEIMTVKLRYKRPGENESRRIEMAVPGEGPVVETPTDNFRFSAAVAAFGMLLRDSRFKGPLTYRDVLDLARGGKGMDAEGYRAEFIHLVQTCALLDHAAGQ